MPLYGIQYLVDYEELGRNNSQITFRSKDDASAKRYMRRRVPHIRRAHAKKNAAPIVGPIQLFRLDATGRMGVLFDSTE